MWHYFHLYLCCMYKLWIPLYFKTHSIVSVWHNLYIHHIVDRPSDGLQFLVHIKLLWTTLLYLCTFALISLGSKYVGMEYLSYGKHIVKYEESGKVLFYSEHIAKHFQRKWLRVWIFHMLSIFIYLFLIFFSARNTPRWQRPMQSQSERIENNIPSGSWKHIEYI